MEDSICLKRILGVKIAVVVREYKDFVRHDLRRGNGAFANENGSIQKGLA
jgi:hypothetical protein